MSAVITGPIQSYVEDDRGRKLSFSGDGVETPALRFAVSDTAPVDPGAEAGTPGMPGDIRFCPTDGKLYLCMIPNRDGDQIGAWGYLTVTPLGE